MPSIAFLPATVNLAEPPEFCGLRDLPKSYRYIGPLLARLPGELPREVADLPRDRPVVYFAMGSCGSARIVAGILEGFAGRPYRVIAPVASLIQGMNVRIPENVVVTGFVPAHKANPLADISVIHGGIGTVMTAAWSGTPVVGIGMQPEQEANLECLVRKGMARRIRKRAATAAAILDAVDALIVDEGARSRAREFQTVLRSWDGPARGAEFLRDTFGGGKVEPPQAHGRG